MIRIPILFLFSAVIFLITSCEKNDIISGVFKGPKVSLEDGKAWTWDERDVDGTPIQVGVVIDDAALNSVPVGGSSTDHNHHSFTLKFESRSSALPFTHVGLNWNPAGHDPVGIYSKPHFDIHFYMISEAERFAIPAYHKDSAKFNNCPSSAYLPDNYIRIPGGDEKMGAHWVDVTSPELSATNPKPFTETFVYGTFDGKVVFYEPMMSVDFLKTTSRFERKIPEPKKYKTTGYYPTKLKVTKHDGVTEIILDAFMLRQAS